MQYSYVAFTKDRKLIKGKVSAATEEAAGRLLNFSGYQIIQLKPRRGLFDFSRISAAFGSVKTAEIVMFSRQLALLLESGIDIVASLELLRDQMSNRTFARVIDEVIADIRGGGSFASALSRHPRVFPTVYSRAIAAGERGGSLEVVLRQMAEYLEKSVLTQQKIRNALSYPIVVSVIAILVVLLLVIVVMPTFTGLYSAFDVELPAVTRALIAITDWFARYWLYLIVGLAAVGLGLYTYFRTPSGKMVRDRMVLGMPMIGKVVLLNELSRASRTMSLLFRVGIPLPDIMTMTVDSAGNRVVAKALADVQHGLLLGEGLSTPMSQNKLFLPLMVQMVAVGEETGNLDKTLNTVITSFDFEADERTNRLVGLIQPALMVFIGIVVGFIAVAMFSAMYSIYGGIE